MFKPIKTENPYIIEVEKGEGFNLIINDLYQKNLLNSPLLLKVYCKISGKSSHAQAGEYLLTSSDSAFNLIDNISKGKIYYRKIRFKEGDTFSEVLNELLKNPYIKIENEDIKLTTIFSKLNILNTSLEGLFHPDTYNFKKGDSYIEILRRSHEKHKQILNEVWKVIKNNHTGGYSDYFIWYIFYDGSIALLVLLQFIAEFSRIRFI